MKLSHSLSILHKQCPWTRLVWSVLHQMIPLGAQIPAEGCGSSEGEGTTVTLVFWDFHFHKC